MLLTNSLDTKSIALREANIRPSVINRPSTTQMVMNNSKLMDMLKGGRTAEKPPATAESRTASSPFGVFQTKPRVNTQEAKSQAGDTQAKTQARFSITAESADGGFLNRPNKSVESRKRESLIHEIQSLASHGPGAQPLRSQLEKFEQKLLTKQADKIESMTRSAFFKDTASSMSSSPSRLTRTGFINRNESLASPPKPTSTLFATQANFHTQKKPDDLFFRSLATPASRSASRDRLKLEPARASAQGLLSGLKDLHKQHAKAQNDSPLKSHILETNSKYLALESKLFKDSMTNKAKTRASSLQPHNKSSTEELSTSQRGSKASRVLSIIGDLERNRALNFLKSGQKSILCATVDASVSRKSSALGSASQSDNLRTGFLNLRRLQQPDLTSFTYQGSPLKQIADQRADISSTLADNKKLFSKDLFKECSGSRFIKTPLNKSSNTGPGKFWAQPASSSAQKAGDISKNKLEAAGGKVFHIKDSEFAGSNNGDNLVVVKRPDHKSKSPSPSPGAARSPMWYVFKYGLEGAQDHPAPQGIVSAGGGLQISSFTKTLAAKLNQLGKQ